MQSVANGAVIFDFFKLAIFIAGGYFAFAACARRARTPWVLAMAARPTMVLALLTLSMVGIKVFEDVITQEAGPFDTAILWFVRRTVPEAMFGLFSAVTWMGAAIVMVPVTVAVCVWLLATSRPRDAVFLATSMAGGWAVSYIVKTLVSRTRPDLWSSTWYWGSSFPSGHTLSAAVFSTALTLIAVRIWPASRRVVLPLAVLWTTLMGLSRLVLGVHWPTDVLAAVCIGVLLPLALDLVLYKEFASTNQVRDTKV